jgi:salicylate 5-hydroxylase small subunit
MSGFARFDGQSRAELHFALTELNTAYAAALDNEAFERWPDFFIEDCLYRIIPRENYLRGLPIALMHCESRAMLRDRAYTVRHTTMAQPRTLRHFVSNLCILETAADHVAAEANFLVLRTMQDRLTEILIAGRYIDRVVRPKDRLLFAERLCVYDSLLIPTSIIEPI